MKVENSLKAQSVALNTSESDNVIIAPAAVDPEAHGSPKEEVSFSKTVRELEIPYKAKRRLLTMDDLATDRTTFNRLFGKPKKGSVFKRSISLTAAASSCNNSEFPRSLSDGVKDSISYALKKKKSESPAIVDNKLPQTGIQVFVDSSETESPKLKRQKIVAVEYSDK